MDKFRVVVAEALRRGFHWEMWGQANGPLTVRLSTPDVTTYRQLDVTLPTWHHLESLWDDLAVWMHSSAGALAAAVKPSLSLVTDDEPTETPAPAEPSMVNV